MYGILANLCRVRERIFQRKTEPGNKRRKTKEDEGEGTKARGKQKVGQTEQREEGASEAVKEVVRRCLRVEPAERPDVDELLAFVEEVIEGLPEDGEVGEE